MADLVWTANAGSQEELVFGDLGQVREILYGGQKGGGKSGAIPALSLMHIAEYPTHARVLILRETFGELDDLMDMMRSYCSAAGASWNEQKKTWTFPCGARLRFGHLGDGCRPYWGREFSLIIIDELTRCIATERDYTMLLGSLRNSKGVPCQVIAMSNPGGPGHAWVKARFMGVPARTIITDPETGLERVFIPAALDDNKHNLGDDYRRTLEQLPEAERQAYLHGDWDAFTGRVFKLEAHHLWSRARFTEHVEGQALGKDGVPLAWKRYRLMDWGFAHPYCVLWVAVDFDGRAWVYREAYGIKRKADGGFEPNVGSEEEASEVAEAIRAIEAETGEKIASAYSGPDLWHRKGRQMGDERQFASWFEERGVYFQPWDASPGTRLAGKMALHERLRVDQPGELPGLVLLAEACPHLVRTLPTLTYDEHQPELVSKKSEDHPYDTIKAFCLLHAWAPRQAKEVDPLADIRARAGGGSWMST